MKTKSLIIALFFFTSATYAGSGDKNKTTSYKINPTESTIQWDAKKVTGSHNGNINLKEGNLEFDGKNLTGGNFTIDMNSIVVVDITDANTNSKLLNHLKSDDFFSVDKHPVSKLVIKNASKKSSTEYELTGDLTIKGITHEIVFPASVEVKNNSLAASANIVVDRTKYDVKFRSGKFFENLGDKLIYDEFTINVNLVANQDVL